MKIMRQPELYYGSNSIINIPVILKNLNISKVLIVTSAGRTKTEGYKNIYNLLINNNIDVVLWDKVQPEPTVEQVKENVEFARKENVEAVIGFGGGSPIDTSKVVAGLITNSENLRHYIGSELIENDALPIIAIPTTAGTGSEVTHAAVMADPENKTKCVIASSKIIPNYAILDPELTLGLPKNVSAYTGMDALTHAIEAFFSPNSNDYTNTFATTAIKLILNNIITVCDNGNNVNARMNMLLGSYMAGIAFANAGVAAVHAFGYPLGVLFHIPHGLVNAILLAPVMEHNITDNKSKFLTLAKFFDGKTDNPYLFVNKIKELTNYLNISQLFNKYNVSKKSIIEMSHSVIKTTRLLDNNPSVIQFEDAIKIYSKII
ncbi:MAG: iron-containing alcohol dehydrogenase [bacterium]|nr:iron-containing alcohol dehydrogenase [bacterium]